MASNIYYDIEDSPLKVKDKDLFADIQLILFKKRLSDLRPIPTKFLQLKTVTDRLDEIWDALILYFSTFLVNSEKMKPGIHNDIFDKLIQHRRT